jgi:hypothetical protein
LGSLSGAADAASALRQVRNRNAGLKLLAAMSPKQVGSNRPRWCRCKVAVVVNNGTVEVVADDMPPPETVVSDSLEGGIQMRLAR